MPKTTKNDEKKSLTTSPATSSSPPIPHHQRLISTPNQQGLTNCPALPMVSSLTLPIEWAGGGSGSAGSIRPPIPMGEGVLALARPPHPSSQTLLTRGPRHPPRRSASPLVFWLFSISQFLSKWLFFCLSRDPKIDPKPPSGQKLALQADFSVICWPFLLLPCFLLSGDQSYLFFNVFFRCIFRCLCLFFPSRRTFKSIGRDSTFCNFQVLWCLHFSLKNDQKNQQKLWPWKTIEK